MAFCRIENGIVIEIFPYNPFEWIPNSNFLESCKECSDEVKQGYIYKGNGIFINPQDKTAQDKRQESYEADKIIPWQNNMITVDNANKIYINYFAEDNEKAVVIKELIKEAKEVIREKYPDMEV